jgi:hypothetical protein
MSRKVNSISNYFVCRKILDNLWAGTTYYEMCRLQMHAGTVKTTAKKTTRNNKTSSSKKSKKKSGQKKSRKR